MPVFLVERYLPEATPEDLRHAVERTTRALQDMGGEDQVKHLSCTFVPSEGSILCVFEGPSRESVEEANRRADFWFDHLSEAIQIR